MKIQYALASKCRFRRKSWDRWCESDSGNLKWYLSGEALSLNYSDILADDWEICTVPEEVTLDSLLKAYERVMSVAPYNKEPIDIDFVKLLAKELGIG